MTRRLAGALLVCVLLVSAGCLGSSVPAPSDAGTSDTGTDDGDRATTGSDGGDGADGNAITWERFAFEEGEYYRFEIDEPGAETAYITWDVQSVDGEEVTVDVSFEQGDESTTETVTGANATLITQLDSIPAMLYLLNGPFNAMTSYFGAREFAVGNQWNIAGDATNGYMTANIEGTSEYAGKECYVATVRTPDGEAWDDSNYHDWDFCIAPDVGLALHTQFTDESTGEPALTVTLVEYRAGGA